MQRRKIFSGITAAVAVSAALCSLTSNAATVDDVAAVARSYGYSEEDIQAGYNAYYENPDKYTPDILDQVIAYLHAAGNQIIATAPQEEAAPETPIETGAIKIYANVNASYFVK